MLEALQRASTRMSVQSMDRTRYEADLKAWQEVCQSMSLYEQEMAEKHRPGCCKLTLHFFGMLLCFLELPFRAAHHFAMWAVAGALVLLTCGKVELLNLHLVVHGGLLRLYVSAMPCLLCANLTSPCSPPHYAYEKDVSIERPPRPLPALQPVDSVCDCCCNCIPILCMHTCQNGPLCREPCCGILPLDLARLLRAAFCVLSCHHSCHPAQILGPLCTDAPGCRCCCEGWLGRLTRWAAEGAEAKKERTAAFYKKRAEEEEAAKAAGAQKAAAEKKQKDLDVLELGDVRIETNEPDTNVIGKPGQVEMDAAKTAPPTRDRPAPGSQSELVCHCM